MDLSWEGVRLERPFLGGPGAEQVQLELEVPGIGEVIWAKAGACFDQLVQAPAGSGLGGPMGLVRRTGYRLLTAAQRDLRLLRDYLFEQRRAEAARMQRQQERATAPLPSILAHPTLGRMRAS